MTTFDPKAWTQRAYDSGMPVRYVYSWIGNHKKGWEPHNSLSFPVADCDTDDYLDLLRELNADEQNSKLVAEYLHEMRLVVRHPRPDTAT